MLTVEDIKNPRFRSGFRNVVSASAGPNGGGRTVLWKARAYDAGAITWRGPYRRTPEAAAQDYVDYANESKVEAQPSLKTAGHAYSIERTERDPEVEAALGVLRDAKAQRQGREGFVYLISDGEYVKIGYSVNPNKRVAELQTGNGRPLRLLGANKGTEDDERAMHQKYIDDNVLMEWFTPSELLYQEFGITNPDTLNA